LKRQIRLTQLLTGSFIELCTKSAHIVLHEGPTSECVKSINCSPIVKNTHIKKIKIVNRHVISYDGNDMKKTDFFSGDKIQLKTMYHRRYKRKQIQDHLTKDYVEKICKYLKNPTSSGLWILKGTWLGKEGISQEILKEIKANEESEKKSKNQSKKNRTNTDLQAIRKTTFVFSLFLYMSYSDPVDREKYNFDQVSFEYRPIIESLDSEKFRKKYSKELNYFKKEILVKGFSPLVRVDNFIHTKSGLIFYEGRGMNYEREYKRPVIMMSLEAEPLEKMLSFFDRLGKITDHIIYPIYSPEEDVFKPYHRFLNLGIKKFLDESKIRGLVDQSISIFEDENYPYCISTIGLALEEQITQIYETLFRRKCPQGLTLGGLVDLVGRETKKKVPGDKTTNKVDFGGLYKKINELLEEIPSENSTNKDVLTIIRDILGIVKENSKSILPKPSSQQSKQLSIFPNDIREGIEELIMYRNAISHRSRIPIGSFEAIKSLFHIASVIMWWNEEKKVINWKEKPEDIIVKMVERNDPRIPRT